MEARLGTWSAWVSQLKRVHRDVRCACADTHARTHMRATHHHHQRGPQVSLITRARACELLLRRLLVPDRIRHPRIIIVAAAIPPPHPLLSFSLSLAGTSSLSLSLSLFPSPGDHRPLSGGHTRLFVSLLWRLLAWKSASRTPPEPPPPPPPPSFEQVVAIGVALLVAIGVAPCNKHTHTPEGGQGSI